VRLDANAATSREARQFVCDFLIEKGRHDLVEPALQCVAELATNAVLHTRRPYEVAVRMAADTVRVDVMDSRPRDLPSQVPLIGTATSVTADSTTGRGLSIVAALARRWGYSTGPTAKFVWAEIGSTQPASPTEPIVTLAHADRASTGAVEFRLENLPVRTAVASGVQVDELVRELQLGHLDLESDEGASQLYELLDQSAAARFAGRSAALRAAAAGQTRFDLALVGDGDSILAVASLSALLEEIPARRADPAAAPSRAVLEFRAWLLGEIAAQLQGSPPTRCPLPD